MFYLVLFIFIFIIFHLIKINLLVFQLFKLTEGFCFELSKSISMIHIKGDQLNMAVFFSGKSD